MAHSKVVEKAFGVEFDWHKPCQPHPAKQNDQFGVCLENQGRQSFTLGFMYSSKTTCLWKFRWGVVVSWVLRKKERKPVLLEFSSDLFPWVSCTFKEKGRCVEDGCNFEKIWVNKTSMSWAWFRKPYLHQNPSDQANSVHQRHYTTALVVSGHYMSRKKSCFGIGMCSQLKKRKTHGTPRNGVQHIDVNHARVVVFVTQGDRMPHLATTFWMHPLFNVHITKRCFNFAFWKILS